MTENIIEGSGNVFVDIGAVDADTKFNKAALAASIIKNLNAVDLDAKALKDLRDVRFANLHTLDEKRLIELHALTATLHKET